MSQPGPQFIPASLVRVRCFMSNTGRLKAKPWATAEETLDAFHDMLRRQRTNDAFWKELEELLAALTRDIEKRLASHAPDNELLDPSRHQALLAEIRAALHAGKPDGGGFRRLASSLSAPAVAMLLLIGGTATVSCGTSTSLEGDATMEPAAEPASEPAPDLIPDPAVDHCDEILADITVNDAPCDVEAEGEDCLHACKSFEEIIVECVPDPEARCTYIDCINTMHESWRTGLTELFACWSCWEIENKLSCDLGYFCEHEADTEFDLEAFLDACHCCIYLGIRFD